MAALIPALIKLFMSRARGGGGAGGGGAGREPKPEKSPQEKDNDYWRERSLKEGSRDLKMPEPLPVQTWDQMLNSQKGR